MKKCLGLANEIANGFNVVVVDMSITDCVYKVPWLQSTNLCNHYREQCVACNVEWNS
eukprot:m.116727 g.116727  ORF g.116727 m.116727 type:complete len:57 (+) comp9309_c2_seq32:261-431(+)